MKRKKREREPREPVSPELARWYLTELAKEEASLMAAKATLHQREQEYAVAQQRRDYLQTAIDALKARDALDVTT